MFTRGGEGGYGIYYYFNDIYEVMRFRRGISWRPILSLAMFSIFFYLRFLETGGSMGWGPFCVSFLGGWAWGKSTSFREQACVLFHIFWWLEWAFISGLYIFWVLTNVAESFSIISLFWDYCSISFDGDGNNGVGFVNIFLSQYFILGGIYWT